MIFPEIACIRENSQMKKSRQRRLFLLYYSFIFDAKLEKKCKYKIFFEKF